MNSTRSKKEHQHWSSSKIINKYNLGESSELLKSEIFFNKVCKDEVTFFDVGWGSGRLFKILKRDYTLKCYTGIDISEKLLASTEIYFRDEIQTVQDRFLKVDMVTQLVRQ